MNEMKTFSIPFVKLDSHKSCEKYLADMSAEHDKRKRYERSLIEEGNGYSVDGYCYVCKRESSFLYDYLSTYPVDGVLTPNWRERLLCPSCGLNNRMRASIHLFETLLHPDKEKSRLYITEQVTPLYTWFLKNYTHVTGSEFFGEAVPWGTNKDGIRNESLTRLSFPDDSFHYILSFDVFEHIPDVENAFRECLRTLGVGGTLFFTAPFNKYMEKNIVRAVVNERNEIEHRLSPEIHGNPVNPKDGCLAFYRFGWEMLDQLRNIGFQDVRAYFYWSKEFVYLGDEQYLFIAEKR